MIRCRSVQLLPGGIRSSSWKVMPYAPSSASLCTASTPASTGRVASPNRSRACQPTVHRPKLNLSSRVGCGAIRILLSWLGVVDDDWDVDYPFAVNRSGHAGERDREGPRTWRPVGEVVIAILQ